MKRVIVARLLVDDGDFFEQITEIDNVLQDGITFLQLAGYGLELEDE